MAATTRPPSPFENYADRHEEHPGVEHRMTGDVNAVLMRAEQAERLAAEDRNHTHQALGKWSSTERFEDEPRISVAFRRGTRSIESWAVFLGQHRKNDDRATLGLSFSEATWDGNRLLFTTILPEDEGTFGFELRVLTPTTAVLTALTENGKPIQDDLKWDMVRS